MRADVDQVREQLAELAEHWPELHRQRETGTPRRWTELLLEQERDDQGNPVPRAVDPACEFCRQPRARYWYCTGRTCPSSPDDGGEGTPICATCRQPRLHRWRCTNRECVAGVTRPAYTRFLPTPIGPSPAPLRMAALTAIALITSAMLELEDLVREQLGRVERIDPQFDVTDPKADQVAGIRPVDSIITRREGEWLAFCRVPGTYEPQEQDRIEYIAAPFRTDDVEPVDMDERVTEAIDWLAAQLPSISDDPDLLRHVAGEAGRALATARQTAGVNEQVQHIKAPCPICDRRSLAALLDRSVIVCGTNRRGETPRCECDLVDCGCHRGYRHTWVYDADDERNEWKVLLRHIESEASKRRGG